MESANTRLYHKRRDAGLCPRCGKERDEKGRTICSICRDKTNKRVRENKANRTPEQVFRDKIRRSHNQNKYNHMRRQQGLCVACGAVSPLHWRCDVCHDKYVRARQEAKNNG